MGLVIVSFTAVAAAVQSSEQTSLWIAFGGLVIAVGTFAVGLLRAMAGHGREQGEIKTQLANIAKDQDEYRQHLKTQLSANEVRLMFEKIEYRFAALEKNLSGFTDNVTYDLRRLRESHSHTRNNQEQRAIAERYLREDAESSRKEDLR